MNSAILQIGEPQLRRPSRPLSRAEILSPKMQRLIERMRATMHDAPGVGLAAPQIGESLCLAVIEDRPQSMAGLSAASLIERERQPLPFQVLINPRWHVLDDSPRVFFEGCLSATGLTGCVPRAAAVRVECLNQRAEPVSFTAQGWHARIVQHEIDHLYGRLYLDRVLIRTLMSVDNYATHWSERPIGEALCELHGNLASKADD